MDDNLFQDIPWNRYILEANKLIIEYDNNRRFQHTILRCILNELRKFYNVNPQDFNWAIISSWYTSQQQLCDYKYVDTFSLLYPDALSFDRNVENANYDYSFSRERIIKAAEDAIEEEKKWFADFIKEHYFKKYNKDISDNELQEVLEDLNN